MVKHNNEVPNNHFRKEWQLRVRTWFEQPMRKRRRRATRIAKATRIAPRPIETLRPVVRCQTAKYNMRQRLGNGFSREELKEAGIPLRYAPTIGIKVDMRRRNKSVEAMQDNVQRLKVYMSKLILFPKNPAKPKTGDATKEEITTAQQVKGALMPLGKKADVATEVRKITDEDKKANAYRTLRLERMLKRVDGQRKKRAAEAAAEKEEKKK